MTSFPTTFRVSRRGGERLPVTVVTGFLGSGKTTLVNHILSNRRGFRAAVIVNELGAIGIDNDLIFAADGGMIELGNGCICCSLNNDLVDSIVRVLDYPHPIDHLIVETTGVADPLPVALTFMRSEFRDAVRLDAIVALVDAEYFGLGVAGGIAACGQLRYADAILLNKTDLVTAERLTDVEAQIHVANPEARTVRTVRSAVPLPLILDLDPLQSKSHLPALFADDGHLNADEFVSISFEQDRPFSVTRFQSFLDTGRPAGLFRGKGFLWLAETNKRYIFHLVGSRFSLDEDDRAIPGSNRLVLIGRDLDPRDIHERLLDCLADAPGEMPVTENRAG